MKKQYKALMIDLDGTLVQRSDLDAIPSKKVRDAIKKAKEKLHVGIVTSRSLFYSKKVLDSLQLSGPCIVQGGAQIVDGATHKILRQHPLDHELILEAYNIARKHNIHLSVDNELEEIEITDDLPKNKNFFGIITQPPVPKEKVSALVNDLRKISELAIFTDEPSVDSTSEYVFGTHITATKQHGILEAAEILAIDTHEIIGIGDSYNDFPLMMACGLKVAMGNAVPELKEIADYIAPPIEKDGVAEVIEKFVL